MFTRRHYRSVPKYPELPLALAFTLGLLSSSLLGTDTNQRALTPPGVLPASIAVSAHPIRLSSDTGRAGQVWLAINEQEQGRLESAVAVWRRVDMPSEHQVWRRLALGAACLDSRQFDAAAAEFALAAEQDEHHAAVHYFKGLLRMQQSEAATAVAAPSVSTSLTDHATTRVADDHLQTKNADDYEKEAIQELELAIRYAPEVDLGVPIVPDNWVVPVPYPLSSPVPPPLAEDLLRALGSDNFVGKAHGLLVYLYLEHERPEEAEHHVDEAARCGISVPYGYRLAGQLYELQGRALDADRAYSKDARARRLVPNPKVSQGLLSEEDFHDLFQPN